MAGEVWRGHDEADGDPTKDRSRSGNLPEPSPHSAVGRSMFLHGFALVLHSPGLRPAGGTRRAGTFGGAAQCSRLPCCR